MRFTPALLAAAAIIAPAAAQAEFSSNRIAVRVEGSGPDVVLIPGLTSQPRVWQSTVKAVPGYRYHLVHVRGFAGLPAGANAKGDVVAPVAEEIARYIREAGLKRPAIVGHSMGGTLGMMIAARHPELVGRLMVVDMVPWMGVFFAGPGATPEQVKGIADQFRAMQAKATPEQRAAFEEQSIAGMVNTASERAAALKDSRDSDKAVVDEAYYELMLTDLRPELPRIAAPMTVLYAKPTQLSVSDEQIAGLYKAIYAGVPNVRTILVPGSAHFIMADAPDRFRSELTAFLAR
ncbi:MAG: alpha/beta hydrolase [Sphingomonadaceae bacterium]|nr:alpha/beta hydrolase [Sphingomonadaceae bacterium]